MRESLLVRHPEGPDSVSSTKPFRVKRQHKGARQPGRWQAGRCASCWSDGLADANGARGGARCVSAAPAGGLTARMLGESLEFVLVNVCAIL